MSLSRQLRWMTCAWGLAASLAAPAFAAGAPSAPPGPAPGAAASPYVTYVTHAGDTLYELTARYLNDQQGWRVLSRLNHVSAPRRMPAGLNLRLPRALLRQVPQTAHVLAVNGAVEHTFQNPAGTPAAAPYTPVKAGMALGEGDVLQTGRDGFVTLEFPDESHVTVQQDSRIAIERLRQTVLTGAIERVIALRRGEVESEVTHSTQPDDRFQIRSPSVVAGVRGTHFRVHYDANAATAATAVEVLQGAVGVDPARGDGHAVGQPLGAAEQLVEAGYGNLSTAAAPVGAPVALLPAPALTDPGKIQDGPDIDFALQPQSAAERAWQVQIGRDADLLDLLHSERLSEPHASFASLPDGEYFVRLSAFDANGLQGQSRVYAFERSRLGLSASARPTGDAHSFAFRWLASPASSGAATHFRFVLSRHADLSEPLIDRPDLGPGEFTVSGLTRGDYHWAVVAERFENGRFHEKRSDVHSFTLAY